MSKRRRNKKKPNLPEATLRRARQQAGLEDADTDETQDESEPASERKDDSSKSKPASSPVERANRRRRLTPVQLERSRQRGELDVDIIEEMLANPTDVVSEEQLSEEYGHVLVDLRNMGILAAVLMVFLVGLAQFI